MKIVEEARSLARDSNSILIDRIKALKLEIENLMHIEVKFSHYSRKINSTVKNSKDSEYQSKNNLKYQDAKYEYEEMSKRINNELTEITNEMNKQTKKLVSKGLMLNLLIHEKQSESYKQAMAEMMKSKFKHNINE